MVDSYISNRVKGIYPSKIREVMDKTKYLKNQGIDVIDFSIGRPDFDTPKHIKEATKIALDKGLVHYTSSAGTLDLREAIVYRLKEDFQLIVEPDEIIVTAGATEANYIATQTILNPGDEVLIPEPMYVYYGGWSFLGGATMVNFPLDIIFERPEKLEKYITKKTKLIILTSPHNPTGRVINSQSLKKIAELSKKYNFLVISDDIYNKMIYENVEYTSIANFEGMKERTLIIGSLSKTYAMDGWRVGYLIAPKPIIIQALKMHQHIISCINTFAQEGAKAALLSSQECVEGMVNEFNRRRKLMMSYLDDLKCPYNPPEGAFYLFPFIKKYGLSSEEFCDYLLNEARIATVPGNAFGPLGEGYVRFAYTTSYENIEKGMKRVRSALEKL
ncbi:MAG: pyridoxal phosphate-dependent aminotransferase [Candidatus Lokiarchaeota archaeon]|nr:pyridoxal phosphate-dependent aminotransferase [Candidatus Lokiarchaeota archaeon]